MRWFIRLFDIRRWPLIGKPFKSALGRLTSFDVAAVWIIGKPLRSALDWRTEQSKKGRLGRLAWHFVWGLGALTAATAGVLMAARATLGDTQPLGLMAGAGVLFLFACAPEWAGAVGRYVGKFWQEICFASLAIATLWVAGAATLGLSRMMSWRDEPDIVLPAFFLVLVGAFGLAAANRGLRSFWTWLRAPWEWLRRLLIFFVFTGIAAANGFLVWRLFEQGELKNTATPILMVLAIVSALLAVWGRDILLRIKSIGTAGLELYAWEEKTAAVGIPVLSLPALVRQGVERVGLSDKEKWSYELGTSVLRHFRHNGIGASELEGRELAQFRRLVLWVGRAALNEEKDLVALEVLQAIEGLTRLNEDELFYLGLVYSRHGFANKDNELAGDQLHRARRFLERAIRQDPSHARAHYNLAQVWHDLGNDSLSTEHLDKAITLGEDELANFARWNKATILLAIDDGDGAIDVLKDIPKAEEISDGQALWKGILEDKGFSEFWRDSGLRWRFASLLYEKTKE